jgi:hypothetical protein
LQKSVNKWLEEFRLEEFRAKGEVRRHPRRIESLAERVPPVYSWLSRKVQDPLALAPVDVSYL